MAMPAVVPMDTDSEDSDEDGFEGSEDSDVEVDILTGAPPPPRPLPARPLAPPQQPSVPCSQEQLEVPPAVPLLLGASAQAEGVAAVSGGQGQQELRRVEAAPQVQPVSERVSVCQQVPNHPVGQHGQRGQQGLPAQHTEQSEQAQQEQQGQEQEQGGQPAPRACLLPPGRSRLGLLSQAASPKQVPAAPDHASHASAHTASPARKDQGVAHKAEVAAAAGLEAGKAAGATNIQAPTRPGSPPAPAPATPTASSSCGSPPGANAPCPQAAALQCDARVVNSATGDASAPTGAGQHSVSLPDSAPGAQSSPPPALTAASYGAAPPVASAANSAPSQLAGQPTPPPLPVPGGSRDGVSAAEPPARQPPRYSEAARLHWKAVLSQRPPPVARMPAPDPPAPAADPPAPDANAATQDYAPPPSKRPRFTWPGTGAAAPPLGRPPVRLAEAQVAPAQQRGVQDQQALTEAQTQAHARWEQALTEAQVQRRAQRQQARGGQPTPSRPLPQGVRIVMSEAQQQQQQQQQPGRPGQPTQPLGAGRPCAAGAGTAPAAAGRAAPAAPAEPRAPAQAAPRVDHPSASLQAGRLPAHVTSLLQQAGHRDGGQFAWRNGSTRITWAPADRARLPGLMQQLQGSYSRVFSGQLLDVADEWRQLMSHLGRAARQAGPGALTAPLPYFRQMAWQALLVQRMLLALTLTQDEQAALLGAIAQHNRLLVEEASSGRWSNPRELLWRCVHFRDHRRLSLLADLAEQTALAALRALDAAGAPPPLPGDRPAAHQQPSQAQQVPAQQGAAAAQQSAPIGGQPGRQPAVQQSAAAPLPSPAPAAPQQPPPQQQEQLLQSLLQQQYQRQANLSHMQAAPSAGQQGGGGPPGARVPQAPGPPAPRAGPAGGQPQPQPQRLEGERRGSPALVVRGRMLVLEEPQPPSPAASAAVLQHCRERQQPQAHQPCSEAERRMQAQAQVDAQLLTQRTPSVQQAQQAQYVQAQQAQRAQQQAQAQHAEAQAQQAQHAQHAQAQAQQAQQAQQASAQVDAQLRQRALPLQDECGAPQQQMAAEEEGVRKRSEAAAPPASAAPPLQSASVRPTVSQTAAGNDTAASGAPAAAEQTRLSPQPQLSADSASAQLSSHEAPLQQVSAAQPASAAAAAGPAAALSLEHSPTASAAATERAGTPPAATSATATQRPHAPARIRLVKPEPVSDTAPAGPVGSAATGSQQSHAGHQRPPSPHVKHQASLGAGQIALGAAQGGGSGDGRASAAVPVPAPLPGQRPALPPAESAPAMALPLADAPVCDILCAGGHDRDGLFFWRGGRLAWLTEERTWLPALLSQLQAAYDVLRAPQVQAATDSSCEVALANLARRASQCGVPLSGAFATAFRQTWFTMAAAGRMDLTAAERQELATWATTVMTRLKQGAQRGVLHDARELLWAQIKQSSSRRLGLVVDLADQLFLALVHLRARRQQPQQPQQPALPQLPAAAQVSLAWPVGSATGGRTPPAVVPGVPLAVSLAAADVPGFGPPGPQMLGGICAAGAAQAAPAVLQLAAGGGASAVAPGGQPAAQEAQPSGAAQVPPPGVTHVQLTAEEQHLLFAMRRHPPLRAVVMGAVRNFARQLHAARAAGCPFDATPLAAQAAADAAAAGAAAGVHAVALGVPIDSLARGV